MLILKNNNKPPSPPTVEGAPQNKQKKQKKLVGYILPTMSHYLNNRESKRSQSPQAVQIFTLSYLNVCAEY